MDTWQKNIKYVKRLLSKIKGDKKNDSPHPSPWISDKFELADALTKVQCRPKDGVEEEYTLESALGASKKAVTEGSMDVLQVNHELSTCH